MTNQYEFSESQKQLIKDLSVKMRFVGYFLIVLGILVVLGGLIVVDRSGINPIIQGITQIIIGLWTKSAGESFERIFKTEENKIENLINALTELRKLYALQYWLLLIALVFIAIALVFIIIVSASLSS